MKYTDPLALPLGDAAVLRKRAATARQTTARLPRADTGDEAWDNCELFEADGGRRAPIEAFIRRHYAKTFGAHIDAFMPRLFGLRAGDGSLRGAFGLRTAGGKLFLEQYLQGAIEAEIGVRCGRAVARAGIVEIGHFSGAFPGAVRVMIEHLTRHLRAENFTWVSFTGTRALRNAFARMELPLLDIAAADSARLPTATRARWGTYYEHAPRVMAGDIDSGYAALLRTTAVTGRCA